MRLLDSFTGGFKSRFVGKKACETHGRYDRCWYLEQRRREAAQREGKEWCPICMSTYSGKSEYHGCFHGGMEGL